MSRDLMAECLEEAQELFVVFMGEYAHSIGGISEHAHAIATIAAALYQERCRVVVRTVQWHPLGETAESREEWEAHHGVGP